ncbi:MAG: hydantoinase B/oxoprolinase family protein [Rhodospirillales bacterium]|nr:hydantoinase B/oxoprolinase family protein [Rhodospirillales bacterium]
MSGNHFWQFWIDRGGTFTDVVARRDDGHLIAKKLLSENPEQYEDAALQGIRDVLGVEKSQAIPEHQVDVVKMGTTVATNALLERKGDRTLLLITEGFKDALRIGYQNRPKLFARHIELPELLYEEVIEVSERIDAHGGVVRPLDTGALRIPLKTAYDKGIRSVAIVLMHAYRHPRHEKVLAGLVRDIGFTQVSVSHKVSPLMKLVSRGDTTSVDAYLSPILRRYVDQVANALGDAKLMFMQSNGGLTDARLFQGKDSILSGPAGGVVGMTRTAAMAGYEKVIGFDMGGTSTDVSHFDGEYERAFETEVAGVRMRAPMMKIHTVAAGGGSILHFDGTKFSVGPDSAGANPGPACYRRGGPLTVTDCNVVLGKLQPEFFPNVFGPKANEPLNFQAVEEKFESLAKEIGEGRTVVEAAEGFLKIAVENMANAIKQISIQRGYDVTNYALNCFGGAGGQHACLVADALGMKTVFIHPLAGVLSAYGMGLADLRAMREKTIELPLDEDNLPILLDELDELENETFAELVEQGVPMEEISTTRKVHLRYGGTDSPLLVDFGDADEMAADFEAQHKKRYGFVMYGRSLVVETVSVESIGGAEPLRRPKLSAISNTPPKPISQVQTRMNGAAYQTPVYERNLLKCGSLVQGPAIIIEENATTIVEPDWQGEITSNDHLILSRTKPLPRRVAIGTTADPVMLEVFNNLFMSIAEQMGATLTNTAYSVNIKERLDFSCALFDGNGQLIANAPHIPVHLGSMGESVESVIRARGNSMKPGDVYALNNPYNGGTHLPDVTVITPVFAEDEGLPLFYVASRGHHADIGGITPGSMPPNSTNLTEEGVLIDNFLLVENGILREEPLKKLLLSGVFPVRNVEQNIADLGAQIAANECGVKELHKMLSHYGREVVVAYMGHVQDNAEETVRRVLDHLVDGNFCYEMDDGANISVSVTVDKISRTAKIDFTGTSAQVSSNFNAPSAVTQAAVLYVFRTLVDVDIPLNGGCLKPLEIIIPEGSMLKPQFPAAVVAGNVETSQAVVDALYGALGVMAAAQGTMNNFTFGNETHQYYETICGGSGAGPDFPGTDGVHTHMTNSRLTDPEVLEWRFPVQVENFSLRKDSGGVGINKGGEGVRRVIKFLEPMTVSLLSGHRIIPPYGMSGGEPGKVGKNSVVRANGAKEKLSGTGRVDIDTGDSVVIETPGGGGYGKVR